MKRWLKNLIIVLLFLIAALVCVAIWQWNNIVAVYTAFTKDSDLISEQIEQAKQEQEKELEEYDITVKPIDTGQTNDLLDGKVTPEEMKEILGITDDLISQGEEGKTDTSVVQNSEKKESGKNTVKPQVNRANVSDLINKCTAELYAIEVDMMAKLGVMKKEALAPWLATPYKERKKETLIKIGLDGLEKCYDLEVVADRQVKAVLSRYRTQLNALKADTKVLDEMWKHYCNKKANQKAYYLNKYIN